MIPVLQRAAAVKARRRASAAPSVLAAEGYAYTRRGEAPFSIRARSSCTRSQASSRSSDPALSGRCVRVSTASRFYGANGYLPDQFLQDGTNKHTGEYGGPIENRARFLLEVTQAAISVWGADRVGVRISPSGTYGSMSDRDSPATFGYVTIELDRMGIAYLHVVEPRIKGTKEIVHGQAPVAVQHLRPKFSRTLIAAGGLTGELAEPLSLPATPTSSLSAATSSPIRICPSGCGAACRSTVTTARPSMAATRAAISTIRRPRSRRRPDGPFVSIISRPAGVISRPAGVHWRPSLVRAHRAAPHHRPSSVSRR